MSAESKPKKAKEFLLYMVLLPLLHASACSLHKQNTIHKNDCNAQAVLPEGVPGSPGHLLVDATNPNGTSELAWLMRSIRSDLLVLRQSIEGGQRWEPRVKDYYRIRCAWPTRADTLNANFDALAEVMIQNYDTLLAHPGVATKNDYDNVVRACVACHRQSCQGPLPALKKMVFDPQALSGQEAKTSCASH
jgi:hypothetical protein